MEYDRNNPRSLNALLGNFGAWAYPGGVALGTDNDYPLYGTVETGFLNLLGESVPIYIQCPSMSAFGTSLGPRGENTLIKKINTKAPFGEVILDNLHNDQDYFLAGGDTLKMISIRLVNSYGHTIPIQQDWSFSLVFQQIS